MYASIGKILYMFSLQIVKVMVHVCIKIGYQAGVYIVWS